MKFANPDDGTAHDFYHVSCATLDTGRILRILVAPTTSEVRVDINIDCDLLGERRGTKNESLIFCLFEILADAFKGKFMGSTRRVGELCALRNGKGDVRTGIGREVAHHSDHGGVAERCGWRIAIQILGENADSTGSSFSRKVIDVESFNDTIDETGLK